MMQDYAPAATQLSPYRALVLALLFVVYAFNFIDRQILGILVPAIRADLHFTDTQLGWLGGPAFAIFYTALGVPIAWLADRSNRVWIMTAALAVWSLFTAACGYATNFVQLFGARLGVGIGEAGGVAPAYSIISDYFPPHERARALARRLFDTDEPPSVAKLMTLYGEDADMMSLISEASAEADRSDDRRRAFMDCAAELKRSRLIHKRDDLRAKLQDAERVRDQNRIGEILRDINEVNKGIKQIDEKK